MKLYRAVKCRIYPSRRQKEKIAQNLGRVRYVFNAYIIRDQKVYERRGHHLSDQEMRRILTAMKTYLPWLRDADQTSLNYAIRFAGISLRKCTGDTKSHPRFKRRHDSAQAYHTCDLAHIHPDYVLRGIELPELGWVRARGMRRIAGRIYNAVISLKNGRYYCSLSYVTEKYVKAKTVHENQVIGLDFETQNLYIDSTGKSAAMPDYCQRAARALAKQQRKLSRMVGSKEGEAKSQRWIRQNRKVNRLKEHVTNQKRDYLNKKSYRLAEKYDAVCVESLELQKMESHSPAAAKHIHNDAYAAFLIMLDYKLKERGKKLIKVDKWYASSQICSKCGYVNKKVKDLNVRIWECPVCHTVHSRDVNAARNIRNKGWQTIRSYCCSY